jgi:hypothetical protein
LLFGGMAFIRLSEHLTVNTQYIVKVKWKIVTTDDDEELAASVFVTGADKNEVVAVRGEIAYKLWDILHVNEEYPHGPLHEPQAALPPSVRQRLRKDW